MDRNKLHRIPHKDPVSGGELYISELTSEETGITIRGSFEIPRYARLDPEQVEFLEIFLKSRGMLNGVERELGISYPTAKARLDTLLAALGLTRPKRRTRSFQASGNKFWNSWRKAKSRLKKRSENWEF